MSLEAETYMAFESASTKSLAILFGIVIGGAAIFIAIFVFPVTNLPFFQEAVTEDVTIVGTSKAVAKCGVTTSDTAWVTKEIQNCSLPAGTNVTISYQPGQPVAQIVAINNLANEEKFIIIPQGAADPSFDPQRSEEFQAQEWYLPSELHVNVGDTVTWVNQDSEKHTVTSGQGSGRFGFTQGKLGKADGIFDSGLFDPQEKWSYTFTEQGTFTYFCTIHPWMMGVITVGEADTSILASQSKSASDILVENATIIGVVAVGGGAGAMIYWFKRSKKR